MDIAQLLAFSVKNGASDLHLSAGLPPMIRVDGDIRRINVDPMEHEQVHGMVYDIMNDKQLLRINLTSSHILAIDMHQEALPYLYPQPLAAIPLIRGIIDMNVLHTCGALDLDDIPLTFPRWIQDVHP